MREAHYFRIIQPTGLSIILVRILFVFLLGSIITYQFYESRIILNLVWLELIFFILLLINDIRLRGKDYLRIEKSKISIYSSEIVHEINDLNLKKIKFVYSSFSGRMSPLSMTLSSGYGNRITIITSNGDFKFELILTLANAHHLNDCIYAWKMKSNIKIELVSEWGSELDEIPTY